jgi:hypothetical protein
MTQHEFGGCYWDESWRDEQICRSLEGGRAGPLLRPHHIATVPTYETRGGHEVNRQRFAASKASATMRSEMERVDRQINDAILEGADAKSINVKLKEVETEKARLTASLTLAQTEKPLLHPNLAAIYRARVEALARCSAIRTTVARPLR